MLRLIGKICLLLLGANCLLSATDEGRCKKIFTSFFVTKHWGKGPSHSGSGSNLIQTEAIRKKIPALFKKYQIHSLVDAPCGDFYWMQHVDMPLNFYIGIDVVQQLIDLNERKFGNEIRSFAVMDLTQDPIPPADCILCRDCLTHFCDEDIFKALANFKKSGAKYLLTTSFVDRKSNRSIATGEWQPLNLMAAPFSLPEPLAIINEECSEERSHWKDKSLLLWKLEDIELP